MKVDIDSIKRPILGKSQEIRALKQMISRVAPSNANVLVIGESGTGKELVARAIHELSAVKSGPFVAVNCGAIPETLIESELFGHKKGSFTGAIADKPGLFETADGGTLFLDEIGELPLSMQVKLLRALQDRAIRRVGGNENIKIEVRIVAATNKNLEEATKNGTFREDLYYRLNVILLETPPLRNRAGDVEELLQVFFERFNTKQNRGLAGISPEAMQVLMAYRWPGNIRELENVMERVVTLESSQKIEVATLPTEMVHAARKAAAEPRELVLKPNFALGPVRLEAVLEEVRGFYRREALLYAGGDESKASLLFTRE
jgi:two-component system response regulator PilR (NtrC family)